MEYLELSQIELLRRKELVEKVRRMVLSQLPVDAWDDTSLAADYKGFYLQVSFSGGHPLMVFCFARALVKPGTAKQKQALNELNLKSVFGTHVINETAGCYAYRATHWLERELEPCRFWEMLDRCGAEAERGYRELIQSGL